MLRPDFEELANSFIDEATFAAIDCQRLPETAKEAGITQHPAFQVLHEVRGAVCFCTVNSTILMIDATTQTKSELKAQELEG